MSATIAPSADETSYAVLTPRDQLAKIFSTKNALSEVGQIFPRPCVPIESQKSNSGVGRDFVEDRLTETVRTLCISTTEVGPETSSPHTSRPPRAGRWDSCLWRTPKQGGNHRGGRDVDVRRTGGQGGKSNAINGLAKLSGGKDAVWEWWRCRLDPNMGPD